MAEKDQPRALIVVPTLGRRPQMLMDSLASIRDQDAHVTLVVVRPQEAIDVDPVANSVDAMILDDPGSVTGAINLGVDAFGRDHEFVGWLGDDDLLTPGSIRIVSDALDSNPRATVGYGHCRYVDQDGSTLWISRAGRWAPWVLPWGPDLIPQPGMLVRSVAWRKVGGLDTRLEFAFDLDLLLKLRRLGPLVAVNDIVSAFRWHDSSRTVGDRAGNISETERVRRKYLPRNLLPFAPLWEAPVRIATRVAVSRITQRVSS